MQFKFHVVVDQILLKSAPASLQALCVDERRRRERSDGAFDALPLRLQVLLFLPAHPAHLGQVSVDASYLLRPLGQQSGAALLVQIARLGTLRHAPSRISVRAATSGRLITFWRTFALIDHNMQC